MYGNMTDSQVTSHRRRESLRGESIFSLLPLRRMNKM
jgi:hypothetical protein